MLYKYRQMGLVHVYIGYTCLIYMYMYILYRCIKIGLYSIQLYFFSSILDISRPRLCKVTLESENLPNYHNNIIIVVIFYKNITIQYWDFCTTLVNTAIFLVSYKCETFTVIVISISLIPHWVLTCTLPISSQSSIPKWPAYRASVQPQPDGSVAPTYNGKLPANPNGTAASSLHCSRFVAEYSSVSFCITFTNWLSFHEKNIWIRKRKNN